MPRSIGATVENNFVRGVVTEFSGFNFPENACVAADNCEFTDRGKIIRRRGIKFEEGYAYFNYTFDPALDAINEYFWKTPGGQGEVSFVCLQLGTTIHFYKVGLTNVSSNKNSFTYNLDLVKAAGAPTTRGLHVGWSSGSEVMVVTHPYCPPIEFTYDPVLDTFVARTLSVKIRDFKIQNNSQDPAFRPATLSDSMRYDLYNQGWTADTLGPGPTLSGGFSYYSSGTRFDGTISGGTQTNRYPSLSELLWYYKVPAYQGIRYGYYPTDDIIAKDFGTGFAPRGKFILDAFYQDRSSVSGIAGLPVVSSGYQRPSCSAFLGGRLFVSGVNSQGFSNKIWFSQVMTDLKNEYNFYQQGDPTSEINFELLPNDGGEITILEAGRIIQMSTIKNALVVFTTNGVFGIQGSEGTGFRANDFSIERLNDSGVYNSLSFVSVENIPVWWTQDSINTLEGESLSLKVKNISAGTVQSIYDEIPGTCKALAKGAYNRLTKEITWLYSEDEDNPSVYSRIMVLNVQTQAFYFHSISPGADVVGQVVVAGIGSDGTTSIPVEPQTKFVVVYQYNSRVTFAELENEGLQDWPELTPANYLSYFVTGYRVRGEIHRKFNSSYLSVVTEYSDDNSCFVQLIGDYSNTPTTGKHSNSQQACRDDMGFDYNVRKLKMRGFSKVNQFRFESEGNKPFGIVGWVVYEGVGERV